MLDTWIRTKEVGKILLEIVLGFPCSFFLGMMFPLNLVDSNFFPSGTFFPYCQGHSLGTPRMIDLALLPGLVAR